jgi:superfamily II DNA/RNA helicase
MLILFLFTQGRRMTVLFSATQTKNVEDLARISLKKAPLYVGVDDHKETATVDGLEQVCARNFNMWPV